MIKNTDIRPIQSPNGTHRQARLNVTAAQIAETLGFTSNVRDSSDGKATHQFCFQIGEKQFACWRYKGSLQFSIWGDLEVWKALFGADKVFD